MPRRRTDFRGLLEPNRLLLLGHVQSTPGQTLKELSEAAGIAVNTVRDHLWALQEEGLVTAEKIETGRRGRPPLAYYAVNDPQASEIVQERLERVEERREQLHQIIGTRPGAGSAVENQLDVLYEHFEDTGLSPTVAASKLAIEVSPGAHKELYEEFAKDVCEVHTALIEDTLALADGPLALADVQPFIGQDQCLVTLYLKEVAPEGVSVQSCGKRIKPVQN